MKKLVGTVLRAVLGSSAEETSYARRGFRGATEAMRSRLEEVGAAFMLGYNRALQTGATSALDRALNAVDLELRGFAFEGATMGLAIRDALMPWRGSEVAWFLRGAADPHTYLAHVGVGWAWARLPFGRSRSRRPLDALLCWLAFDGWGFHEGYFHWPRYESGQAPPRCLAGYEKRVFDQGMGRSFWFVNGGNPAFIARRVAAFPAERQADLWSGVGLAAAYAGIAAKDVLAELRQRAGPHWPQLAQGAAFASKARQRAGNLTEYSDAAARVLCQTSALEAARVCDQALENLPATADPPAFELWRRRIQNHFQNNPKLQEA
jgi:enediyne biosynthesis protein E3